MNLNLGFARMNARKKYALIMSEPDERTDFPIFDS